MTKPYSEPIQTVLTTSPNRTWKQLKPYSICTRTQACFLSFSVGLTRKIRRKLTRFRFQTVRETVLGQRMISGLPNANAKSQCFGCAIPQCAPLRPVVALKSQFLIAKSQRDTLRFGTQVPKSHWPLSFSPLNRNVLNRSVFNTQTQLNRKR